ncbi:hypothetical protein [Robertkochia solimangrovi]|uniref:hypothetical protein n=1 Tax=Robertkochia solimangrovi TaxID=2213046 RepID=UPI00117EA357|nr:hypothetical protein [Robertkochia solimangrovi]TRZ43738.1 hypothetical protein DMZ48_10040 [Robertkochia solimangrovi]
MKKYKRPYQFGASDTTQSPVYQKAIEIFKLSRQVVNYISGDKNILQLHKSENPSDLHSDHLVMASLGLAPKIAMAESSPDLTIRLNSVRAIRNATINLLQHCDHLENRSHNGKEFIRLLRFEIKKFRRMQRQWATRVCYKN